MSSTKNAKNAKSRGHASGHEARSDFAGSGNSAQVVEQASKTAACPVDQATKSGVDLTAAFSSPPPPPKTPYPGSSSSAVQNPPLPKDDRARSSTADAAVGALGLGADAQRVRDRSPLRHPYDGRAEWMTLLQRQDARHEAMHSSFVQSMQGLAHSLSAQQQQQQQHFEFLVAQGSLPG